MPRHLKRAALIAASFAALLGSSLIPTSSGDLSSQLSAAQSSAASLQAAIRADTARIDRTSNGVAEAKQQLATVQAQLSVRVTQLRKVQTQLMEARDQLANLEHRLKLASDDLADNLRAQYENGSPNLVDVILNSKGFASLLNEVNFLKRVRDENAQILAATKVARTQVLQEALRLGTLEQRDRALTDQILAKRNQAAAIEGALVQRQINEESARAATKSKLSRVNSRLSSLQSKLQELEGGAGQDGLDVNEQVGGLAIDTDGMVQPPPGAPEAVREMIAAGNAIATLPYIWGGGHSSFVAPGYDCSGSVSYVLAAAGLLSSPEVSGQFESYGDPGVGRWVTIYATNGHVWMEIAGWRFDTVALAEYGTRWARGGGEFAGFVARHPPGL